MQPTLSSTINTEHQRSTNTHDTRETGEWRHFSGTYLIHKSQQQQQQQQQQLRVALHQDLREKNGSPRATAKANSPLWVSRESLPLVSVQIDFCAREFRQREREHFRESPWKTISREVSCVRTYIYTYTHERWFNVGWPYFLPLWYNVSLDLPEWRSFIYLFIYFFVQRGRFDDIYPGNGSSCDLVSGVVHASIYLTMIRTGVLIKVYK